MVALSEKFTKVSVIHESWVLAKTSPKEVTWNEKCDSEFERDPGEYATLESRMEKTDALTYDLFSGEAQNRRVSGRQSGKLTQDGFSDFESTIQRAMAFMLLIVFTV